MMKILYIATANPFVRSGGGIANLAYYKALNHLYPNSVDMVLPEEQVPTNNSIHRIFPAKRRSKLSKLMAFLAGSIHRYKECVSDILKKEKYDICFINGGLYAGDMMSIFKEARVKTIVMHHNFEREYQSTVYSNLLFKHYYVSYTIKNERNAYLNADVNLFITNEDKKLFEKTYGKTHALNRVIGVFEPSSVKINDYKNKNNIFTAVISGSVNADQTIAGIRDFHDNYWDVLKNVIPNYELIFTGRNADRLYSVFHDFNDKHIKIIPNPEDINEIVSMAHLYICPINVGGGLKLRVMDGLRMGLPVLTHQVSARGYEPFFSKPYFRVYHDKKTFEEGLKDLIHYIQNDSSNSCKKNEYDSIFGIDKGVDRFRNLINQLKEQKII